MGTENHIESEKITKDISKICNYKGCQATTSARPDADRQTRILREENTGTEGIGAKAALRAALKRMKDDFEE